MNILIITICRKEKKKKKSLRGFLQTKFVKKENYFERLLLFFFCNHGMHGKKNKLG